MKKILFTCILSCILITYFHKGLPLAKEPSQDSEALRQQDMLVCLLTPNINQVLEKYYGANAPSVTPWKINIIETKRVQHFRGFILDITFDIEPTTGHHVSVGKDRMTFRISYGPSVELIEHKHLMTYDLPPETLSFDFNQLPPLFKYVLSKPFK